MLVIARIKTDFPDKFGIPRQSGLVPQLIGRIIFEPEFASPEAVRGIEDFSHLWLLWGFSNFKYNGFSPTVRPPRLGGNARMGVFATRSPNRPNGIGLSAVKLERLELDSHGSPVLIVSGTDLMDGTPIYDIKPYIPLSDCIPTASEGYTSETKEHRLEVVCSDEFLSLYPENMREALLGVLSLDPRPGYNDDPDRIFGLRFGDFDVKFKVDGALLTVIDMIKTI